MNFDFGAFNNWGPLKKVAIRTVDAAFVSDAKIDAELSRVCGEVDRITIAQERRAKLDAMANADCVPWFVDFAAKRAAAG